MLNFLCMSFNIEFQIASFLFVTILGIIFFSKPRWNCIQNTLFRVLIISTWIQLFFDIVSVITIYYKDKFPLVTDFFCKGYIFCMFGWITTIVLYIISNTLHDKMSKKGILARKILIWSIVIPCLFCMSTAFIFPMYYGGEGRYVYSYGVAPTCTYIFSGYAVCLSLSCFIASFKYVGWNRRLPTLFFTLMEGIVALMQGVFEGTLIIGLGSALCLFIIYLTMENPDMDLIDKLDKANRRTNELLLNILPYPIACKLFSHPEFEQVTESYKNVTVSFIDIVDFTKMSSLLGSETLVKLLNQLFCEIDSLLDKYRIEKIKTIGDAYMVAAGVPERYADHTLEMIYFCEDVLRLIKDFNLRNKSELKIRIGVHCGPVVAGIIGKKKYTYDLWGETVNFASRMESTGVSDRIQVSQSVYEKISFLPTHNFEKREISIKGVGMSTTYLVLSNLEI